MTDSQGSKEGSSELRCDLTELSIFTNSKSSHKMASCDTDEPLRFMDLPAEIRNKVYEHTLANPSGKFHIGSKYSAVLCRDRAVLGHKPRPFLPLSDYPAEYAASTRNLAILRTNKTVYDEAGMILYGQKLVFIEMVALQSFLTGLRQPQISMLRHVAVCNDVSGAHKAQRDLMPSVFALLTSATRLECLRIPGTKHIRSRIHTCIDGDHDAADDTISVACWDSIVARNLAAEVYGCAFTYLRVAVPARGIDKVMEVLRCFQKVFEFGRVKIKGLPAHVAAAEWTEERKVALKKVMGQQIVRLLEADKN